MDRNIYLFGEIDGEMAKDVISQINKIEQYDIEQVSNMDSYTKPHINLYINSCGGSLSDGLAIIDKIQSCQTYVNTIAIGECMSMALAIFVSGDLRSSGQYTQFMYHQVYAEQYGIHSELSRQVERTKALQKTYNDIIIENTTIGRKTIETWEKMEQDLYFDVKRAKKHGFVDILL